MSGCRWRRRWTRLRCEILRGMKRRLFVLNMFALSFLATLTVAQTNPASLAARNWRQQHERAILDEFVALLAIPNIAADRVNIQRNAESIAQMMQKRGVPARLVSVTGGNP